MGQRFSNRAQGDREKWLGDVVEAEIHFDRYDQNLEPQVAQGTPGPGAGIFYDLGPHLVDQALQLFGMPRAIFADITILRPISKVDDYIELIFVLRRLTGSVESRLSLKNRYTGLCDPW